MSIQSFQDLIVEGIQELPEAALAEIADFVYFVRLRSLNQKSEGHLYASILSLERAQLANHSQTHLEEEFADYDAEFPQD